jgi:adenosylcobinamide-phosphate synthase
VAHQLIELLGPDPLAIAVAVLLDLAIGDPVYGAHPVRLMGWSLAAIERGLRRIGADGYAGGIVLFVLLAAGWTTLVCALLVLAVHGGAWLGWVAHVFFLYSFIALGDLLRHGWSVERAAQRGDLDGARTAIARLVGRDVDRMDEAACRRAAIESLSESLTDGFTSALFWYALGGIPGLVIFKVVSTMDSMVGYRTPRYLRFGWCGARADDLMNFVPARLTWLLVSATALVVPGCSAAKAFRVGLAQHAVLLGPNAGWSEAATAGAIQRRLVGPIWLRGHMVTNRWIGDPSDPPVSTSADFARGARVVLVSGLIWAALVLAAVLVSVPAVLR